jgi:hypothetical protein
MDACVSQRDVLAKKAVAFFKKSRSSVTRLSSLRKRCSSSSCELILPLPGNASTPLSACWRRQRCSWFAGIPRSAATAATVLVPSLLRRTASSLYSGENCCRFGFLTLGGVDIFFDLLATGHSYTCLRQAYLGVHQTGSSPTFKSCSPDHSVAPVAQWIEWPRPKGKIARSNRARRGISERVVER